MAEKMSVFEMIAIADMISTVALEFWAEYKSQHPEPMTAEEFAAISGAMRERRKTAIAAISKH